ncbi:hypothetical protein B0I35DRAFT_209800 [Stachybotrys elegans]|uniref:Uncharacterized protein n=1 Tax=Stachybotrys elegans TaxID=80388 RepID=A0A8K0SUJ1_9HYPO|nr:hypothetical protein B0I35DRAFT_209800 [Stachybotrys elegans]
MKRERESNQPSGRGSRLSRIEISDVGDFTFVWPWPSRVCARRETALLHCGDLEGLRTSWACSAGLCRTLQDLERIARCHPAPAQLSYMVHRLIHFSHGNSTSILLPSFPVGLGFAISLLYAIRGSKQAGTPIKSRPIVPHIYAFDRRSAFAIRFPWRKPCLWSWTPRISPAVAVDLTSSTPSDATISLQDMSWPGDEGGEARNSTCRFAPS